VRELTQELVDVGRRPGEGSVSFLMTRLMELAGSVTGFVQELQHYELRRRDEVPVVCLAAGGGPVTVVVPSGETSARFAFFVENDLAQAVDGVALVPAPSKPSDGGSDGGLRLSTTDRPGEAAGPGEVQLLLSQSPWLWGERRRVAGTVTVGEGFADSQTLAVGFEATVLARTRPAPSSLEIVVQSAEAAARASHARP
jgi:hypothetical protein